VTELGVASIGAGAIAEAHARADRAVDVVLRVGA
jgi:hypothetical protein